MQKQNQCGFSSFAVAVTMSLLFVMAAGFAGWAFMGRQDYKDKSDKKVATAVNAAKASQKSELEARFAEESKNPYKTYQGPVPYGSVKFQYPKTWNALIDESSSSQPIDAYFYPDRVPGLRTGAAFALRVEFLLSPYSNNSRIFDSQVKSGKVKASAYVPPKMNGIANVQPGMRFDGTIAKTSAGDQNGSMVLIPIRDKTLKIYTLSNDYVADFNNVVLSNLTFIP